MGPRTGPTPCHGGTPMPHPAAPAVGDGFEKGSSWRSEAARIRSRWARRRSTVDFGVDFRSALRLALAFGAGAVPPGFCASAFAVSGGGAVKHAQISMVVIVPIIIAL